MYIKYIQKTKKTQNKELRATRRFSTDHECEVEQCINVSNYRKIYIFKTYTIY